MEALFQSLAPEIVFSKDVLVQSETLSQILIKATSESRLIVISSGQLKLNPLIFNPGRSNVVKETLKAESFFEWLPKIDSLSENCSETADIWKAIGLIAKDIKRRSRTADQRTHIVRLNNLISTKDLDKGTTESSLIEDISTQLKLFAGLEVPGINFKIEAIDINLAEYGNFIRRLIVAHLGDKYDKEAKDRIVLVMPEEQANNSHN